MSKAVLSRRDFLKLSGFGLMGMVLPNLPLKFPQQDDFDKAVIFIPVASSLSARS
jgi:hypothetical protein